MSRRSLTRSITTMAALAALATAWGGGVPAGGQTASSGTFSVGQLQAQSVGAAGCGTNEAGEPAIHVSPANLVAVSSERGLGGGTEAWRGPASAGGCGLEYRGQPNAVAGVGLAGGDTDLAFASGPNAAGAYRIYVASLNLGSVAVAHSDDNGQTWVNMPVQVGLPLDDREWIAAYGAATSLLTYHDIATNNIDVLRSDDGGTTYVQIAQVFSPTDYRMTNNQHGNIVIDHRNTAGASPGQFWAYQSFVAPSSKPSLLNLSPAFNEAFVAVSSDGGARWTIRPIPCSTSKRSLNHQFPNVSVAPNGALWASWSDDVSVFTATSSDHGTSWSCSPPVSTSTGQAVMPWMVATSAGVDLVYYGTPTPPGGSDPTWSVYFAQNPSSTISGWGAPVQVVTVHKGEICGEGVSCTSGRQLLDDFGVDTDQSGFAHIAYSHDAPDLGGSGTYTGYAVQVGGTPVGFPN